MGACLTGDTGNRTRKVRKYILGAEDQGLGKEGTACPMEDVVCKFESGLGGKRYL